MERTKTITPKRSANSRKIWPDFGKILAVLSLALLHANVQGQCPNNDLVQDPQDFQWTYHPVTANNPAAYYSGVMEAGEATFNMNNGTTLTTRAYRQQGGSYSIPGPTITVVPGNKYVLKFHNTLPYAPLNPKMNILKDPNVSNIHTHGLHISPASPSDDVTRSFEGGRGGDFVWEIPADHMGGTFWYHAHHHGSTWLQVAGGLFGLLVVEDSNDGIPAPVAAMTERELVLGYLDMDVAGRGDDVLMSGTFTSSWTVNGLVEGNICMPPNTWQHWRVALADANSDMKTIEFGPGCEVMLLARDGVWRTVAPLAITSNQIDITGASRADFAIRTTGDSWVKIDGNTVANIYAVGTPDASVHPYDLDGVSAWSANRPSYLRDLRNETNVNFESISMGARTINGGKWDPNVPSFTLPASQVQEWSLSGAVQHPFHLHVYHVQALKSDKGFEAGEYYDVVAAKMDIRFDLNTATTTPFEGMTIMHCHILGHEDRGAMTWLDLIGGAGPPTFPADGDLAQPYSLYYTLGGGQQPPAVPTNLSATTVSSSNIDLTWEDNSVDEDGFDIERSTDGTNFNFLASVGTDVEAYSDNTLNPSTTYYYLVTAFNSGGNSAPSNIASATTQGAGGGVVMHVDHITVVREALNGNRFRAVATATIYNGTNAPVSGATVDGIFTGPNSGNVSGTTDGNGLVSFNSKGTKNPVGEWCFEVINVSLSGATYNSSANIVTKTCESGPVFRTTPWVNTTARHDFRLLGVNPNPFRNSTQISFRIHQQTNVSLEVYNLIGERIALLSDRSYEAGQHYLDWNTRNIASGTYVLHLKAGRLFDARKLILVR